jgi:hypothetical protein
VVVLLLVSLLTVAAAYTLFTAQEEMELISAGRELDPLNPEFIYSVTIRLLLLVAGDRPTLFVMWREKWRKLPWVVIHAKRTNYKLMQTLPKCFPSIMY